MTDSRYDGNIFPAMHRAEKAIATYGVYELFEEIACGGMATVRLARWIGHNGFSRVVAVKELYPQFARDSDFVAMFLDEARLSARVRHPNVVQILDIVSSDGDLFLVMDYVHGESVARLHKLARLRDEKIPTTISCTILVAVMHGLHAAHEARTERGEPLQIIHRDVTPQNVLVGVDGCPRILDFGVAQASGRLQTTRDGQLKGKLCYMAPEQLLGGVLDRRVDIYSASAMLWEMLAGRKLFTGANEGEVVKMVLDKPVPPPSMFNPEVSPALDRIVLRGLQREPELRFSTALEVALAIEQQTETVPTSEVGSWVERVWGDALRMRTRSLTEMESGEKSAPIPTQPTDQVSPVTTSPPQGDRVVRAADDDHNLPDRSMADTRKIVGPRSPPSGLVAPNLAVATPLPVPKVARVGGVRRWAWAAAGLAGAVLLANAVVQRSRGAPVGVAIGTSQTSPSSAPREADSPVLLGSGESGSDSVPTDMTPGANTTSVNTAGVPGTSEVVNHGKSRTRRRTHVARTTPNPALRTPAVRTKDQRESPSLVRRDQLVRAECDPPFTIDASGIKRMKLSCL
jgi:serine/threonine protein kinase